METNLQELKQIAKLAKIELSAQEEEKLIKHNGFSLPFVVDLSYQLKDYGVIDKEYYSVDRLVSDLWK